MQSPQKKTGFPERAGSIGLVVGTIPPCLIGDWGQYLALFATLDYWKIFAEQKDAWI